MMAKDRRAGHRRAGTGQRYRKLGEARVRFAEPALTFPDRQRSPKADPNEVQL